MSSKFYLRNKSIPLIRYLLIAVLTLFFLFLAKPSYAHATVSTGSAEFRLFPSASEVSPGEKLSIIVKVNSDIMPINVVQFNLAYPMDKLRLLGISTQGSAFSIQAQETVGNGVIKIARGVITPVAGENLVATITFQSLQKTSVNELHPYSGMAIIRSTDDANIYSSMNIETPSQGFFPKSSSSILNKAGRTFSSNTFPVLVLVWAVGFIIIGIGVYFYFSKRSQN